MSGNESRDAWAHRVLLAFPGAVQRGDQWHAPCPAHGGRGSNLRITFSPEGRLLLYCWSHQCDHNAIRHAAGLEVGDLFAPDMRHTQATQEARPKRIWAMTGHEARSVLQALAVDALTVAMHLDDFEREIDAAVRSDDVREAMGAALCRLMVSGDHRKAMQSIKRILRACHAAEARLQ